MPYPVLLPTIGNHLAELIDDELARARTKFPSNTHMLAALMEEVGELSKALLECGPMTGHQHVLEEAIQVAVVAIRIATEGDPEFIYRSPLNDSDIGTYSP